MPLHPEVVRVVREAKQVAKRFNCPFVVHRLPEFVARVADKEHHCQVLPGYATQAFQKVRDGTGLFKDMATRERPTLHEIRALTSYLLGQYYDEEEVREFLAHTDVEITRQYQAGHEQRITMVNLMLPEKVFQ